MTTELPTKIFTVPEHMGEIQMEQFKKELKHSFLTGEPLVTNFPVEFQIIQDLRMRCTQDQWFVLLQSEGIDYVENN